jgi:hypothetical protein
LQLSFLVPLIYFYQIHCAPQNFTSYEATTELLLRPRVVEATHGPYTGKKLSENIAIVPILRGGLGMVRRRYLGPPAFWFGCPFALVRTVPFDDP